MDKGERSSKMEHVDWQINKSNSECSKYILEKEVDCDVSFKVGEDKEVIKAHKLILRMRSPVFDRMFNGGFQESEKDPVIPDISHAVFQTLLRYCYYDCLDIEGDVALSVLYVATKYMLPILERAARKTLIETLDSSKIWDACEYSTAVDDKELQAGCIKYLKGNLSKANILDVIKFAVTTGHEELNAYFRKHLEKNLSESNILDIIKYVVSIEDEELRAACTVHLKGHLSGSNIWEVYRYALNKGDTKVHQHCRKYFVRDVTTVREALQSEEFPNIEYEVLLDVLHINDEVDLAVSAGFTPGISISEIELFTACNTWAEAECLRQWIDPTGANKRTVLSECLSLIRFPTMLTEDLATVVYPTVILKQAGMVNIGQYIRRDPGSECQVYFPSRRRQFVVAPSRGPPSVSGSTSTVCIESKVRVMLSKLWTWNAGSYKVTVRDERSKSLWSMVLDTKHRNHLQEDTPWMVHYIDITPPQVLEAGSRYAVTAEYTQPEKVQSAVKMQSTVQMQPGVEYFRMRVKYSPYTEVKVTRASNNGTTIGYLTLSLT